LQAARDGKHRRGLNLWSIWSDHGDLVARADRILPTGATRRTRKRTGRSNLPHGDQRKLEVALLMALEPQVFMFDEPTAGLNAAEAPGDPRPDPQLRRQAARPILLVEHKMDVVRELADPHHRAAQADRW
jgi:branched-chain amino acid transport system ATP-binding protein